MNRNLLMNFSIDKENKKITVEREFAAPLKNVWAAWTERELLDQWWAPKPWKAKTKTMDFKVGGHWLYAMVGPDSTTHWSRSDFQSIVPLKSFTGLDAFCDESGTIDENSPKSLWEVSFSNNGDHTMVLIETTYEKLEGLEIILAMGFKEGFTGGLENLDALLAA